MLSDFAHCRPIAAVANFIANKFVNVLLPFGELLRVPTWGPPFVFVFWCQAAATSCPYRKFNIRLFRVKSVCTVIYRAAE